MAVIDFTGKVILAPMVRINTLPTRLMALEYGADIVYTEEMIDFKLVKCRRIENVALGTVDFLDENHEVILRTCEEEKSHLVAQIGSADPDRCLAAAKLLEKDVSAIDVNMGCPKSFSLKGGMGAALLSKPEVIHAILTNLVQNLSIPVTCKIRVLPTIEETVKLVKMIEKTGVLAIGIHGRNIKERPYDKNRDDFIAAVAREVSLPVIANGGSSDIKCYADIERFRARTGASSVMLARVAEHNPSIFDSTREKLEDVDELCRRHIRLALKYENKPQATKYALRNILEGRVEVPPHNALNPANTNREICAVWGMETEYDLHVQQTRVKLESLENQTPVGYKRKLDSDDVSPESQLEERLAAESVITMPLCYHKKMWFDDGSCSPKTILHDWCLAQPDYGKVPAYETISVEKNFISILTLHHQNQTQGAKYASVFMEKNKKCAEQSSALVACIKLGLIDESKVNHNLLTGALSERTLKNAKFIKSQTIKC